MDKIKWTAAMLADLTTMQAIHNLTEEAINYVVGSVLLKPMTVIGGLKVVASSSPDSRVVVKAGNAIGPNGEIIAVASDQIANILSGIGSLPPPPVASWGNGAGTPILGRNDIVAIKYATYDGLNEMTWFIDDTVSPPGKHPAPVDKRIYQYFIIGVFHGLDDGTYTDPVVPPEYIQLARIKVTPVTTQINQSDITQITEPLTGASPSLLDFIKEHAHTGSDGTVKIDYNDLLNLPTIPIPRHNTLVDIMANPNAVSDHDGRYAGSGWMGVAKLKNLIDAIIANSNAIDESGITAASKFDAARLSLSATDAVRGYLYDNTTPASSKIIGSSTINISKLNAGTNEQLQISANLSSIGNMIFCGFANDPTGPGAVLTIDSSATANLSGVIFLFEAQISDSAADPHSNWLSVRIGSLTLSKAMRLDLHNATIWVTIPYMYDFNFDIQGFTPGNPLTASLTAGGGGGIWHNSRIMAFGYRT